MHLSDAHHSRKMLAGACMVVAPLVLLAAVVIHPASDMDEATQVATIADNLDAWYVAHLLALVAIALMVPAVLGLMHMLREREVAFGHVGGGLAMLGLLAFTGIVAMELVMWQLVGAGEHRSGGGAARAAERDDGDRDPVRARFVRFRARDGVPGDRALQGPRGAVVDGDIRGGRRCPVRGRRSAAR